MARKNTTSKTGRRGRDQNPNEFITSGFVPTLPVKRAKEPLKALNQAQGSYIAAIKSTTLVIGSGPAGTGKTYIAAALAAEALNENRIEKIIITRPVVEAGESLGFLPGEIDEKFDPYLQPFRDVLNERLGKSAVDYLIKQGTIVASPLAYMRGKTFRNAFVILDEAQNTTPSQMKLFLTRIGQDCRVVVDGDVRQKDIHGESGLADAIRRLSGMPDYRHVEFTREDIVRSGLVQMIVERYED